MNYNFKGLVYGGGFLSPCSILLEVDGVDYETLLLIKEYPLRGFEPDGLKYPFIEMDLDTFKYLINNIPGRDLSDKINMDITDEEFEDLKTLQKDFGSIGIHLSLRECEEIHSCYSDSLCAGFIGIGESADLAHEIHSVLEGIYRAMEYDYYC